MPRSFRPLNTEKKCTLLVRGEEITSQVARASNSRVPGIHVHQEMISLWSANFKCVKWRKNLSVHRCLVFKI